MPLIVHSRTPISLEGVCGYAKVEHVGPSAYLSVQADVPLARVEEQLGRPWNPESDQLVAQIPRFGADGRDPVWGDARVRLGFNRQDSDTKWADYVKNLVPVEVDRSGTSAPETFGIRLYAETPEGEIPTQHTGDVYPVVTDLAL